MAKILLIETATEVCAVAIAVDGEVIAAAEELDQPRHAERLTLLIRACTQQAGLTLSEIDAVAVSRGPGSYTSLRVGISTAKGICYALDKPLIAVDTLQALAVASLAEHGQTNAIAIPMLDARRQEVWTAVYNARHEAVIPAQPLILEHDLFYDFLGLSPVLRPDAVYVVAGNGAKKMKNVGIIENLVFSPVENCSAKHLAVLAERFFQNSDFEDITYFEPFYMKAPNITTPNKPLF